LTQDPPREFKLYRFHPPKRVDAEDNFERRRFVNVAALIAVVALIVIAYSVFNALGHSRRFQRCLDSGRVNCVDFVNPAK
jgi:hypothetical protein